MDDTFSVTTTLRRRVLSADKTRRLRAVKERTLGKRYSLSFVLIGDARSRTLNRIYRNKNKPTNVLAFPLSESDGEVFVNVDQAMREAKIKEVSAFEHIAFLFIHGCLHLKGMQHGATMETEEQKLLRQLIL